VHRRGGRGERPLERGTALLERPRHVVVVAEREQVERDEPGRSALGQQADPARRRVQPLLERPEVQRAAVGRGHHDLAVDDAARRQAPQDRLDHLREVAGHRALVAAADLHLVAVAEHDRAEAVELRLVELAGRDVRDRLGEHRGHRGHDGQAHR
jgi:hypothetical protein